MRKGKGSLTAELVSAWRGLAGLGQGPFAPDPIAKHLVSSPARTLLELAERLPRAAQLGNRLLDAVSLGVWRHLPLRTRAIDDAIAREVRAGTHQVVLLGAGLDARAYRLAVLAECTVLEVDHPSTQANKMQATRSLARIARHLHYVAVDFEKDDVGEALVATGFEPLAPAVFVWEGVTMYLPAAALTATLSMVERVAASGSCLLATYYDRAAHARTRFARPFFSLIGEPLRTALSREEVRALLAAHGFDVEADDGDGEWGERYVGKRPILDMSERLVTARRR